MNSNFQRQRNLPFEIILSISVLICAVRIQLTAMMRRFKFDEFQVETHGYPVFTNFSLQKVYGWMVSWSVNGRSGCILEFIG